MAFLSIVSFLSIEKQMMLREWRRAATHHKSLINWAMRVLAKEILGFKCVLSEIFWCEWPFLGILSLNQLLETLEKVDNIALSKLKISILLNLENWSKTDVNLTWDKFTIFDLS